MSLAVKWRDDLKRPFLSALLPFSATLALKPALPALSHILHPNTLQFIPQCDTLQSSGNNTLQCHILDNISIMADGSGSEPSAAAVKMSLSTIRLLYRSSSVSGSRQLSFYWAALDQWLGEATLFFGQMCATGRRWTRAQIKEARVIFLPSTARWKKGIKSKRRDFTPLCEAA